MYVDETIVAGLLVVAGTLVFLGGFGYFAYKDAQKSKKAKQYIKPFSALK